VVVFADEDPNELVELLTDDEDDAMLPTYLLLDMCVLEADTS
jgi:hypothetical protein